MIKRLFTFGCSFTAYCWPTWADILGREFDIYQNWGRTGAGNQFILHALTECYHRNMLNQDDTVCIMWTNVCREDRYVNHEWHTPGNIFTQKLYDKEFVKNFADIRGYYIRDLSTIWLVDQFLEKIKCKKYYFSMVDIHNPGQYQASDASHEIEDLLEIYQPLLQKIQPSIHRVVFNLDWNSRPLTYFTRSSEVLKNWRLWYKRIRDESWPACACPDDFARLPVTIQLECKALYAYDRLVQELSQPQKEEKQRIQNLKIPSLSLLNKQKKTVRFDLHAIPAEYLEYLRAVCQDIELSQSTLDWVNEINELGLQGSDYNDLYLDDKTINSIPKRW